MWFHFILSLIRQKQTMCSFLHQMGLNKSLYLFKLFLYIYTMKILKFGGSSVSSPERVQKVINIILDSRKGDCPVGVVFSAFGGVTDQLIEMSDMAASSQEKYAQLLENLEKRHLDAVKALIKTQDQIHVLSGVQTTLNELKDTFHGVFLVKELSLKTLDFIMSFGERLSAYIICETLKARHIYSDFLDARHLIKTDANFGSARVDIETTYLNIQNYFKTHKALHIITGFIGSTPDNETTTLGRGGSDYMASLFGAALKVNEIEIWSDVDGVMTADPRKVTKAFSIQSMTYEEAMEMSHFGAKVIHPPTMQPASTQKIPIRIRNTFNPDFEGTVISKKSLSPVSVKGISSIDNIALLQVQGSGMIGVIGVAERLFSVLAKKNISVILISQASSEHSICLAVDPKMAEKAQKSIEEEFRLEIQTKLVDKVIIERDLSIIAVVGENMKRTPGIAGTCFQALGKNGINVAAIAQGSSELNISIVIDRQNESKALNALHEAFFLSDTKSLNLFVLGTGLIGSTLLRQIKEQSKFLLTEYALDIHIIAIGNIEKMTFDENNISPDKWEKKLDQSGVPMNVEHFVEKMINLNLPKSVFVDCTDSEDVVACYEEILSSNISIVTPNKKANSGSYEQYKKLKDSTIKHGIQFLYETNVGAGLPVISTLNDLMCSGDKILKIEAILSGTLSFIFNTFNGEKKFSEVVLEAKEKGLSEPDPRDDLNGLDVARKLLILARETGLALEPEDIFIENILPENCQKAESIEAFFTQLKLCDADFEKRRQHAEENSRVLRYIATFDNNKACISLQELEKTHPFYALSGSDNMIVFTTERYKERPLVIKGPGAGAEVTAAGVFADIIRISNYLA